MSSTWQVVLEEAVAEVDTAVVDATGIDTVNGTRLTTMPRMGGAQNGKQIEQRDEQPEQ